MKIYDISQEVFACQVYPGDPVPERKILKSMENGETHNLTAFSMCAHNGTHVDAPYHFLNEGKRLDQMPLNSFVGDCYVTHHEGEIDAQLATKILEQAKNAGAGERILIGGKAVVIY